MTIASPQPLLALVGGTKIYGATIALWRVDFAVAAGEAVAVVGGNGSGKSTLLRALAGVLDLESGERIWDATASGRPRVALLGHQTHLFGELTTDENVRLGARGPWREPTGRQSLLGELELGDVARRRVDALSAGTRRRAGLARAIATDPAVLLVDEPFAMVDGHHTSIIGRALAAAVARGTAVVVAAHDVGLLADICGRSVCLAHGRVQASARASSA